MDTRIGRYFFSDGHTSAHIALIVDAGNGVVKALVKYNINSLNTSLKDEFGKCFEENPIVMTERTTKSI